jgi:2,4'-dihydroxyacetophenone dioxygenase
MKVVNTRDMEWEDPPRGYYLTDVKQKVLWEDEKTGATMALIKFPVGVSDKIHSHPEANQLCLALSGAAELTEGEAIPLKDVFVHFPRGERHGATNWTEEGIVLFYWDGPPRPEIVE